MMYDRCDLIEDTQRLGSKDVGLRVKHIGLIINGRPDDALENKPFTSTFTKENNLKWIANVGRAPNLTRKSLNDKRLRSSQEDIEDGVDSRARTSKAKFCLASYMHLRLPRLRLRTWSLQSAQRPMLPRH